MMKRTLLPLALLGVLFATRHASSEEDPLPELSAVAERYVAAYNGKDLDSIVSLYTEEAEMLDDADVAIASGREEIRSLFEFSFADAPGRRVALEVTSVRRIAPNLVVEEGVARFSAEEGDEEDSFLPYSAILTKGEGDAWQIASTRQLRMDEDAPDDPLLGLRGLAGEWVMQAEGMQMELFLEEGPSGSYLLGVATMTTAAEGEMITEIRVGYDPLAKQVRWWTFDEAGGFGSGAWQPLEGGRWLVRTNGVTADGESSSAIQELSFEGEDTIVWESTRRFLDGEAQPDLQLRLVRRPPAPSLFEDNTGEAETDTAVEETPAPPSDPE
jgi:uncharacterized protein (TIGR02246 family)